MQLEEGSIIQITDESHPWLGCLLTVTEVKTWGCQAFVAIPNSNEKNDIGLAFNRMKNGQFEVVGYAALKAG